MSQPKQYWNEANARAWEREIRMGNLYESVSVLVEHLKADSGYRESWKANIAMAFKDQWFRATEEGRSVSTYTDIHIIANKAAENFLLSLCRDITKNRDLNELDAPGKGE